jgi:hypothetical protein
MEVLLAEPDFTIDVDDLRELHRLLTGPATELRDDMVAQLDMQDPTEVAASFDLELRQALAGTVGAALSFTELVWRLAYAIANLDPDALPETGTIELDRLAPQHETRLEILEAELSSFLSRLKPKPATLATIATVLTILSSISQMTGVNLSTLPEGARADGSPCLVELDGRVDGSAANLIEEQLPGLPNDCTIKLNVETLEGARLTVSIRGAGLE